MKTSPSVALALVLVSSSLVFGQTNNRIGSNQDRVVEITAANASGKAAPGGRPSGTESDSITAARENYESGLELYTAGKFEDAIVALREANKLRDDDAQSHYLLGMAFMQSKAYKDAADSFRRAVRVKPDWAEANFRFGVMSYVLGRRGQSTESYKKLLSLNSPLANTLYRIIRTESDPAGVAESVVAESDTAVKNAPPPLAVPQPTVEPPSPNSDKAGNGESLSATSTTASTTTDEVDLTNVYKIGVGDVLDVRLLNSSITRSSLYTVLDGGVIDLPVAGGAIPVVGLTTEEVQARIATELRRRAVEDRAQVSVGVRHYASHTVVVTGLVGSAGTKVLRREAVPLYVILADVQPRLDAARVVVMRTGSAAQTLELNDSASLNFIIRPGDVLNVTARPQEFYYIAGRVNFPGQKNFQAGITLLQAVLAAGGAIDNAKSVELSREGEGGLLTTTKINLKEIKSGKVQDVKLLPGDRIEVRN
jgi:protein involved in polysaccharide export with SLBB domain